MESTAHTVLGRLDRATASTNLLIATVPPYSYLGGQGAGGMGYGAPASVGAALAAKARNRFAPGVLCKLPMLTVMHNNRAWHQEYMFV
jgi:hypothetical protein